MSENSGGGTLILTLSPPSKASLASTKSCSGKAWATFFDRARFEIDTGGMGISLDTGGWIVLEVEVTMEVDVAGT